MKWLNPIKRRYFYYFFCRKKNVFFFNFSPQKTSNNSTLQNEFNVYINTPVRTLTKINRVWENQERDFFLFLCMMFDLKNLGLVFNMDILYIFSLISTSDECCCARQLNYLKSVFSDVWKVLEIIFNFFVSCLVSLKLNFSKKKKNGGIKNNDFLFDKLKKKSVFFLLIFSCLKFIRGDKIALDQLTPLNLEPTCPKR